MSRGFARRIRHSVPKAALSITSNSQTLRHLGIGPTARAAGAGEAPAAEAAPVPEVAPAAEAAPAGESRLFRLTRALPSDDLLVAYPTVDRNALRAFAADEQARRCITIMADSPAHLDVVDQALGGGPPEIRVCLELDVSWRPLARKPTVHIGSRRSPLHTPQQAADF